MRVILISALRERIRRKELYIVVAIGILLILLCSSDGTSITMNGEPVTGFNNMFMVMHVLVNAIGCILAVMLSVKTIPNEYERKNSHLVWVRRISQTAYHGGLAAANVLASVISVGVLYMILAIYVMANGYTERLFAMLPAFCLIAVNVSMVSLLVSVLSIRLPGMAVGALGILFAGLGIFHGLLEIFKSMAGGIGGKCMSVLLRLVPDLHGIQKQAYNLVIGKQVELHLLFIGLLAIWIFSLGLFVFRRKEA